jgi:CBS domain-containing protein
MNISEIMTRRVISVRPETTIAEAARLMLQHRISGLPVVNDDLVVGIITEGDLLRRAETGTARRRPRWLELLAGPGRLAGDYVAAHARQVGEVMSENLASVVSQDDVAEAVRLMERRHIKRLLVIEGGKLVGIVTRANLVRALLRRLTREPKHTGLEIDGVIHDNIIAAIDKEPWGPRFSITVKVADGIVDFFGSITDERERTALRVVAENIPGVKEVRDHLVWVEPVSGFVIPAEGTAPPATAA